MTDEATALAEAAYEVREAARVHKRSEFAHRRQARALMQKFDELKSACDRLGITIRSVEAKGAPHGHRSTDRSASTRP